MAWIWFLVFALGAVYVIAGYPVLLAWLARRNPRPVKAAPGYRTPVSILVAVYNGGAYLAAKLDSLLDSDYPNELLEIVVASDGSTDETAAIARRYGHRGVRLLELPRGGKPAALNAAMDVASHPILLFTDVRQTLDRSSISNLVACFADASVGAASGYLVIRGGTAEEDNVGLYWRYERWIRTNLSALDSIFGATGAFYAMRRELVRKMPADLLLDDMFLPLGAFFQGYRLILEEKARIYDFPTGVEAEFRRKVRTLAGNYQLFGLYPELFTARNRMLLHFLSYKFGRLLLAWFFVGALIASFFLPSPFREAALLAQALFYGLAVLDRVVPKDSFLKKATSPAWTVVGMLTATACAISILFVPAQRLWKPTK
jgi:cellulose synthase/poly-beta-1,6-N-acetylglucosamine synthase-like glycosyltransferase